MTNRCLNLMRDRRTRTRLLEQSDVALRGPVRTTCEERAIDLDLLLKLVRDLPADSCEMLVYRYLDDMSQDEIAELTASAAALLLVLRNAGPGVDPPESRISVKGGELALGLVRLHEGSIAHDPTHFVAGDRFKLQLTAPPDLRGTVEVVVFQEGAAFFPLPAYALEDGANLRTLPGAFSLDGGAPAIVCAVVVQERRLDHRRLDAYGPSALPSPAVCSAVDVVR